jgi:hypothetical protein
MSPIECHRPAGETHKGAQRIDFRRVALMHSLCSACLAGDSRLGSWDKTMALRGRGRCSLHNHDSKQQRSANKAPTSAIHEANPPHQWRRADWSSRWNTMFLGNIESSGSSINLAL